MGFVSAQWGDPGHIALNLVSMAFLAVVLVLIVRVPQDWLGGSRWAKVGWAVFAVGLTGVINGVYLPVGAAVALRRLARGRRADGRADGRFPCGSNIPGRGVRLRTSWPLAELVISEYELRLESRGPLRRLGGADIVRLHDVTSAQALTSRFGGGVLITISEGEPWYIFTFRPERVLEALRAIGTHVSPGVRRISIWDQM
jgi:hypothetical protein